VPQLVVASSRVAMAEAADCFFGEPTRELQLAGVTGTNGKTNHLLSRLRDTGRRGRRPGLVGTVESRVGGKPRKMARTTPEAIDLQRLFREMLDLGDRELRDSRPPPMRSSLHRLDRGALCRSRLHNLSQDHLDFHETMEN